MATILVLMVFTASGAGTWAVRKYALARDLIDVPNERSSHTVPTPRGGGLPLAILVPLALIGAWTLDVVAGPVAPALAISGGLVALFGWIDDHGHVSAAVRFLVQALAAGVFLFMIGGMPTLTLHPLSLHLGWVGSLVGVVGIVWTPMTSQCTAQLLADLGVTRSLSRPQVSDDNPFSEAQFKTLKYHPSFPGRFDDQGHATTFRRSFFPWYNTEDRHGGISMLTPEQVHFGLAHEVIARRQDVLCQAWAAHPERFVSGPPRIKPLQEAVWINPPRPSLPTQKVAL